MLSAEDEAAGTPKLEGGGFPNGVAAAVLMNCMYVLHPFSVTERPCQSFIAGAVRRSP